MITQELTRLERLGRLVHRQQRVVFEVVQRPSMGQSLRRRIIDVSAFGEQTWFKNAIGRETAALV